MKRSNHYNTMENYLNKNKDEKSNHPYQVNNPSNPPLSSNANANVNVNANSTTTTTTAKQAFSPGIRLVDSRQAFNLLINPQHNTKNGIRMKVVLICSASWCNPCKLLLPKLEELAAEPAYKNISFLKVDCSEPNTLCPELRNLLNIDAVPIIYAFLGNKQIDMVAGSSIAEIENLCDRLSRS